MLRITYIDVVQLRTKYLNNDKKFTFSKMNWIKHNSSNEYIIWNIMNNDLGLNYYLFLYNEIRLYFRCISMCW